eukprot:SAG22_NODE_4931_length_1128_cov_1.237123_2_plen_232_part_00
MALLVLEELGSRKELYAALHGCGAAEGVVALLVFVAPWERACASVVKELAALPAREAGGAPPTQVLVTVDLSQDEGEALALEMGVSKGFPLYHVLSLDAACTTLATFRGEAGAPGCPRLSLAAARARVAKLTSYDAWSSSDAWGYFALGYFALLMRAPAHADTAELQQARALLALGRGIVGFLDCDVGLHVARAVASSLAQLFARVRSGALFEAASAGDVTQVRAACRSLL